MSKKRVRLKPIEAEILGKSQNKCSYGNAKYRLTAEEVKKIEAIRNDHSEFQKECNKLGIDSLNVSNYWYKGKHFSINVKPNQINYESVRSGIIEEMDKHSPVYEKIVYENTREPHLLVIDPADIHIGKLVESFESGETYNTQLAVKRVLDGVRGIIKKSQGFDIDKILLVAGNDVLHIDTPRRTTTSGTPQDTDGMWYSNFLMAKQLYVEIIELLTQIAPVHFVFNPSNHDYISGFFLADVIQSWFRLNNSVSFDCSIAHRKYYKYGKSLIGTTHGDGAKWDNLPLLMAQEAPTEWSKTIHRYVYTHHVHHKISKDMIGVTIESLRSPSATDSWHHRNGYQHAPKAIEGFIHHPKHGQVARLTHLF